MAEALRKTAVPFGVSTAAQCAALASLDRQAELMERVADLVSERVRVREALLRQGWTVPESQANFLWLRLGEQTTAFAEHCREAGVMVRPHGQDGVRITPGEPQANDALVAAAARYR